MLTFGWRRISIVPAGTPRPAPRHPGSARPRALSDGNPDRPPDRLEGCDGGRETLTRTSSCSAAAGGAASPASGALYPLGSDESAPPWSLGRGRPSPTALYGTYWVDRPPILIALVKAVRLRRRAGLPPLRAALGCVALVPLSAAPPAPRCGTPADRRAAPRPGTALGPPCCRPRSPAPRCSTRSWRRARSSASRSRCSSFYLALRALVRDRIGAPPSPSPPGPARAPARPGMKQILGRRPGLRRRAADRSRLPPHHHRRPVRLAVAAADGRGIPVLLDDPVGAPGGRRPGRPLVRGVRLPLRRAGHDRRPTVRGAAARGLLLLGIALGTGVGIRAGRLALHRRRIRRSTGPCSWPPPSSVTVDGLGADARRSFWRPYLFAMVPGVVLCTALLLAVRVHVAHRPGVPWSTAAVVSVLSDGDLDGRRPGRRRPPTRRTTGLALADAADPDDTVVVHGGRAEIVLSGMSSPYEHLWTLPMRTLDPDLEAPADVLAGPDPRPGS